MIIELGLRTKIDGARKSDWWEGGQESTERLLQARYLFQDWTWRLRGLLAEPSFEFQCDYHRAGARQGARRASGPGFGRVEDIGARDAGRARQTREVGAARARDRLPACHLVEPIVHDEHVQIGGMSRERHEIAEAHEHAAVAVDDNHAALRLRQRQAKTERGGMAHGGGDV